MGVPWPANLDFELVVGGIVEPEHMHWGNAVVPPIVGDEPVVPICLSIVLAFVVERPGKDGK